MFLYVSVKYEILILICFRKYHKNRIDQSRNGKTTALGKTEYEILRKTNRSMVVNGGKYQDESRRKIDRA